MGPRSQETIAPKTPAEVLKTYIVDKRKITQDDLARALNVSRLTVNQLLNGKRSVTALTALKLAHVIGNTPDFWLNLQRDVDLHTARQKFQSEIDKLTMLLPAREASEGA